MLFAEDAVLVADTDEKLCRLVSLRKKKVEN